MLQQLHDVLAQEYTAVLSQSYALSGLGGIGKTQTAIEYAYRHANDYAAVFWISAETTETIITSMVAIATLLNLPEMQEHDQEKVALAVTRWLSNHRDWLLILDNIEDPALVKRFLPPARCGSLLFTSRRQVLGLAGKTLDLEQMTPQEGLRFLLHRSRRLDPTLSLADFPSMEKAFAQEIVAAMDGLPLALEQAGAYIEETGCSFGHYLQLYQNHRSALLARRGMQTTNYPDSVATTWSLSFQQVEQANPAAAELLRLCAFLAPDHIPEELFTDASEHWPPVLQQATANPIAFDQLLAVLLSFSLIKRLTENHLLNIHRLVQVVQLDMMSPGEQHEWAERIVHAVNTVFPHDPIEDVITWPLCLRYLEQVQACNTLIQKQRLMFPEAADLLDRSGTYLRIHASYSIAKLLYQQALSIREQQLGSQHPETAKSLNNLGNLYWQQGKYEQAEPLFVRALSIREQQLGPQHSETAKSLNNLSLLYWQQGKYEQAEPLSLRALSIQEQQLGLHHPDTATSLNNLGILYGQQGKYEQTESLFVRALSIREQQLGPQHPNTAISLNNLAELYFRQGKYEQAEPLHQRALAIREQQFGLHHPETAHSLNNLGLLYLEQGKYEQAEPLHQRALAIREQQLGPQHPDTAESLNNLAILYFEQGKYEQAEPLFKRALDILEQTLTSYHPDLATILHGFARLYEGQGNLQKAVALYQRALTIREQVYGPHHPKTIETRESLHTVLHLMSKDEREAQRDAEHLEQEGMKDTPDEGENVVTEPESTKWT